MSIKRVFVFEGYIPRGGTYMAYQIGRICYEKFGVPVYVVGSNKTNSNFFNYDYEFPVVSTEYLHKEVKDDDLLICNPSFSNNFFGIKLPCKKLMYIQDIKTFQVLDVFFDYYVSVSSFVQDFISRYYNIKTQVILPFINHHLFNKGLPWEEREDKFLVLNFKEHTMPLLEHIISCYKKRYPFSQKEIQVISNVKQEVLAELMGRYRYYLTLSPVEGFGLLPLEAMASGCAVFGFDGMGGREYFKSHNSYVVQYGSVNELIELLYLTELNPEEVFLTAKLGMREAQRFTKQIFDENWFNYLSEYVFK